jgi:hypothetical protein
MEESRIGWATGRLILFQDEAADAPCVCWNIISANPREAIGLDCRSRRKMRESGCWYADFLEYRLMFARNNQVNTVSS